MARTNFAENVVAKMGEKHKKTLNFVGLIGGLEFLKFRKTYI